MLPRNKVKMREKMHFTKIVLLVVATVFPAYGIQDIVTQISTMRWSQVVSERFLSLSVDPLAIILAGKFGPSAVHMAKGLSPIFVRIGGPNTENVNFSNKLSSRNNISVTEDEWVSVNKFAQAAKVDIVLCLSAMRRTQSVWDSANALEIISASHKHGFTDIWQMGWDMSEMSGIGGAELGRDIVRLKKILDAFPGYENAPILAPGLSCCANHFQTKFIKDLLQESTSAVSALPVHMNFSGISLDKIGEVIGNTVNQMDEQIWGKDLLLRSTLPRKPIWMSEMEANSGEFRDAIKWIVKLGSAAKNGVQVMMRQPHMWSFHSPTHDYWASLLHKNLVGRFVFDTRITSGNRSTTYLYSHCTQPTDDDNTVLASKWSYEKGALTIYGVNPHLESTKFLVRGLSMKEEMVHLYILTEDMAPKDKHHQSHTLFNGQKLMLSPRGELPAVSPKVRKVSRGQAIPVPPNSIFFMVFPDVKIRMCMSNPFSTDEFQDLSKRLTTPHPIFPSPDDSIDSWEDNNAERNYVSFSRRVPVHHSKHSHSEDLKSKFLKDWHKVTGRLGLDKDYREPESEHVKYNFYNDQTWLNKLAESMNKEREVKKNTDTESEASRQEKYALLTSAIYGKAANGTDLFKAVNDLDDRDSYGHHFRFARESEKTEGDLSKKVDEITDSNKDVDIGNRKIKEAVENDNEKIETAAESDVRKIEIAAENQRSMHDHILNLMQESGKSECEDHSIHHLVQHLGQIDVKVDDKNEETDLSHNVMKRSVPSGDYARNYNSETGNPVRQNQDFTGLNDNRMSLSDAAKNDLTKVINENMEKGAPFEITPEPEMNFDSPVVNFGVDQPHVNTNVDAMVPSDSGYNLNKDNGMNQLEDVMIRTNSVDGSSDTVSNGNGVIDGYGQLPYITTEGGMYRNNENDNSHDITSNQNVNGFDQGYSDGNLKEPSRYGKLNEFIEQFKSSLRECTEGGGYRNAKLEERIQKLESIRGRVAEMRDKIRDELSKAREKLALNLENMKSSNIDYQNGDLIKSNMYDIPDRLAAFLERFGFSNMKPNDRYTRSSVLGEDYIDDILEQEIAAAANELYGSQISDSFEDYSDKSDDSNFHYLVPLTSGTRNVLFDKEVFPAKIYNMVKGNRMDMDKFGSENINSIRRSELRDYLNKLKYRKNQFDQLYSEDDLDGLDERQLALDENNFDDSYKSIFEPMNINSYKNSMKMKRRNRRYPYDNVYNRYVDEPVFVYPRGLPDINRYKRSLKKSIINDVDVNDTESGHNNVIKKKSSKNYEVDNVKLLVDNKFSNKDASLHQLAEEYTKLINKDPLQTAIKDQTVNSTDKNFTRQLLTNEDTSVIKKIGENASNEIDLLKESTKIIDNLIASEEENEEDGDYSEDWVANAERISPPRKQTKTEKSKKNPTNQKHNTVISGLLGKIRHLLKFISEFKISDYIKGKKD